ncbi:hypothetical protein [Natronospira bacteriovora]|uniref:Uncharacterized protein n=1 Tax=Natronospira bacteriovora TaxID=3069753 RepID=A0ABU0W5K1_9GAMM|nr:hypothetical protein [Natronospira sp. AB-CW4]MDQ2069276.1 hypothetical protein [Natronospira sp. AB-CW4]
MKRHINGTDKPASPIRWARADELHKRCTLCRHCTPRQGAISVHLSCELRNRAVMPSDTCSEFDRDEVAA